jgi:hypothetical protein
MEPTFNLEAYVEQAAQLLALPLDPDDYPGVVQNFATLVAIANLVMEFPLPEDLEAAPTFEP